MKRRALAILLCLLTLLPLAALGQEKLTALPAVFAVRYESEERMEGKKEQFIYKEYLRTTNEQVNQELADIVDGFDALYAPQVPPDPTHNARRNNRLDIETTYYRTGHSWLSTMVCARIQSGRAQVMNPFTTRTWDLETGQRILLTDIFPEDSAAWAMLSARVIEQLNAVFPGEERDAAVIERLATKAALAEADFTLGGVELTLHYEARVLLPERTGLMHVRFFYPEFAGMMTPEAARQTDNRHWNMVAITPDDGPRHNNSIKSLNAFRQGGARITYFEVGTHLEEGADIVQRQFDQNHLIGSHAFNHWSGYSMGVPARQKQLAMFNETLTSIVGEPARLFRAPGGTYPPWVEAEIGLPLIQWSVDTYDYRGRMPNAIVKNVRDNVRDGDILLMHDTGEQLYKAIPDMCQYLADNGYLIVSVEELAIANGIELLPNVVYHQLRQGDFSERRDSNTN